MGATADVRELATGLEFPEGPIAMPDGSTLLVEIHRGTLSRVTTDGKVEVVADLGGGPNGAAIGPDGACYVVNNGGFLWSELDGMKIPFDLKTMSNQPEGFDGGWVNRVDLATGEHTVLYRECDGQTFCGPNDIVFDTEGGFWFTDFGKTRARDADRGGVYYAKADGSSVVQAARGLNGPNGIGLSPAGDRVYVAESFTGRLLAWDLDGPGKVRSPMATVVEATKGHFDSLAVEESGARRGGVDRRRPVRGEGRRLGARVRRAPRPLHHQRVLHRRRHANGPRDVVGQRSARRARLAPTRTTTQLLTAVATIAEFVHARADDGDRVALHFEDETWTWAEYVEACAARAAYLLDTLDHGAPPHIGVLLDNTPEFTIWLGAVALTGTRARRHQPDAAGSRARARHHAHRLPGHRHRGPASQPARRSRPGRGERSHPRRRHRGVHSDARRRTAGAPYRTSTSTPRASTSCCSRRGRAARRRRASCRRAGPRRRAASSVRCSTSWPTT